MIFENLTLHFKNFHNFRRPSVNQSNLARNLLRKSAIQLETFSQTPMKSTRSNSRASKPTRTSARILAGSIAALLAVQTAKADNTNATWLNTGATDANWSTTDNWLGGVAPGSTAAIIGTNADSSVATFDSAVGTYGTAGTPIVIDSTSLNLAGITFADAAGSFTIGNPSGNPFYMSSGGTIQILASLSSADAVETIAAPLVIEGAGGTFTLANHSASGTGAGTGTLNITGGITGGAAGATVLTLAGSNTNANTVSGLIANGTATSVAMSKSGAGTWVLSGANTFTGAMKSNWNMACTSTWHGCWPCHSRARWSRAASSAPEATPACR